MALSKRFDRKRIRAVLSGMKAESVRSMLDTFLATCGEHARELRMPASEFVELAVAAYCEATDRELDECVVDQDDTGYSTTVVMVNKWRAN